jgi:hypothetical protein
MFAEIVAHAVWKVINDGRVGKRDISKLYCAISERPWGFWHVTMDN